MSTFVTRQSRKDIDQDCAFGVVIAGRLRGYVAYRGDRWRAYDADYQVIETPMLATRTAAIQIVRTHHVRPRTQPRPTTKEHLFHLVRPIFPKGHR